MNIVHHRTGWIEVIAGCMFSGKTEELIRRLRRASIARQKIQSFKPIIDNRYSKEAITSHDDTTLDAMPVAAASEILLKIKGNTQVVGIDEAQFFGEDLVDVCQILADRGIRVIVAGLDQDYLGVPFGPMPNLLSVAEYVHKQSAICVICGNPASRTQKVVANNDRIQVGATEAYEARCRFCFDPALPEKLSRSEESINKELQ